MDSDTVAGLRTQRASKEKRRAKKRRNPCLCRSLLAARPALCASCISTKRTVASLVAHAVAVRNAVAVAQSSTKQPKQCRSS